MKGHWWFLTLFWLDDDQEMFSTAHVVFFKETMTINLWIFHFFKENIMGGRKHFLIIVGPEQRQEPPVSFHNTYRSLKTYYI